MPTLIRELPDPIPQSIERDETLQIRNLSVEDVGKIKHLFQFFGTVYVHYTDMGMVRYGNKDRVVTTVQSTLVTVPYREKGYGLVYLLTGWHPYAYILQNLGLNQTYILTVGGEQGDKYTVATRSSCVLKNVLRQDVAHIQPLIEQFRQVSIQTAEHYRHYPIQHHAILFTHEGLPDVLYQDEQAQVSHETLVPVDFPLPPESIEYTCTIMTEEALRAFVPHMKLFTQYRVTSENMTILWQNRKLRLSVRGMTPEQVPLIQPMLRHFDLVGIRTTATYDHYSAMEHPNIRFSRENSPSIEYEGKHATVRSRMLIPPRFPFPPDTVYFQFDQYEILGDYDGYNPFEAHVLPFMEFMKLYQRFIVYVNSRPVSRIVWTGNGFICEFSDDEFSQDNSSIRERLEQMMLGDQLSRGANRLPNVDVIVGNVGGYTPAPESRWVLSTVPMTVPGAVRFAIVSEDKIYQIAALIEAILPLVYPKHRTNGTRLPPDVVRSVLGLLIPT